MPFCVVAQEKFNIYFDFDRFDLNDSAIKKINTWIADGKDYEVTKIYGFCDWKGTNKYNDTLAIKRVYSVCDFLKSKKIAVRKNIEIRAFGENFEQSKIQSENRRVTLIYAEKKETTTEKNLEEQLKERFKSSKKGDLIKLPNFYFYNNSAKIVPKSEPILSELLCLLVDNPKLKIEIQGHICCKLPNEVETVSSARAKAIYNYLILHKIDRKRMTFKGFGVTKPIYKIPERNVLEENENRRVEIMIVDK